jgi:hypothetical protein
MSVRKIAIACALIAVTAMGCATEDDLVGSARSVGSGAPGGIGCEEVDLRGFDVTVRHLGKTDLFLVFVDADMICQGDVSALMGAGIERVRIDEADDEPPLELSQDPTEEGSGRGNEGTPLPAASGEPSGGGG